MKTNTFRIVITSIAAATLLGVSACSTGGDEPPPEDGTGLPTSFTEDLVEKAQAEGELVIYMTSDEKSVQKWSEPFTEMYGITVTTNRNNPAALAQQIEQEYAAGQRLHDIVITTDELSLQNWNEQGILGEYAPSDADLWPTNMGVAGYYYPFQNTSIQTVAWNTDTVTADEQEALVEDPLEVLMDPSFRGRIGLTNPGTAATQVLPYYNFTDGPASDLYGGWDLLEGIAANEPIVYGDLIAQMQGLVIGEVDVIWGGIPDGYVAINHAQGAPVAYSYPSQGTSITGYTGVASDAAHPNAARLFQEWAATPESAALFSQTSNTYPLNSEVEDARAVTEEDWFTPVSKVIDTQWTDWASDPDFVEASAPGSPWLVRFNELFGITG